MNNLTKNDIELLKKLYPKTYKLKINKAENGYPVQYLIGYVDFCGYKINVNKNVLIPRFETEWLVDKTVKYIKEYFKDQKLDIIDLGTGSGCIAIALKKLLYNSNLTAVDIDKSALKLAQKNANDNNISLNLLQKSIENVDLETYDIIISNPPYIPHDGEVDINVKKYEPKLALYASDDGLYFYKSIVNNLSKNKRQFIAFEIGYDQGKSVESIVLSTYPQAKTWIEKDLNNKDRYFFAIINE